MEEKLLMRNEVPKELTWDLSLLYKSDAEMEKDIEKIKALTDEIEKTKGSLNTAPSIVNCLEKYEQLNIIEYWVSAYVHLAVEVDYYDNTALKRSDRVSAILSDCFARLSFVNTEIAEQNEGVLNEAKNLSPKFSNFFDNILREKPHMLHPEAERVLAAVSNSFETPYTVYSTIKLADMRFGEFEANGKKYPLGYSLFEDKYEYEPNTEIRRNAFRAFYDKLKQYENGTAAAYNAYVQQQKITAQLRGFEDIFAPDLFNDRITREMYDFQIDTIMERLSPYMRKLAVLIKKIYKIDRMTYADLKLPIDPDYSPDVSIEKAKEMISEGLSILGDDYVAMVKEAFENRWFDFAQNQGKCTGGFCETPYRKNSYILMSWCGKMSDVFTAAHELGHAGHFKLCNDAQCIFDTQVPRYFVEAPSTMNELIMANYMLKKSDDKRFRRWVLANMISNTYYHNFVTHFLEAYYQREVYRLAVKGESVQADTLSDIFKKTLEKFWGDTVELTEGSELTWMRQPHYYMGLYSYSYSAGLTVATEMCKRIENEGAVAAEDWKKVLTAGSTLSPIGLARLGGIEVENGDALIDTIDIIGGYIDEIIALTEELEA